MLTHSGEKSHRCIADYPAMSFIFVYWHVWFVIKFFNLGNAQMYCPIFQHLKWAIQRRRSRAPVPLLHICTFSDAAQWHSCPRSPLHSCSSSNPLLLSLLLSWLLSLSLSPLQSPICNSLSLTRSTVLECSATNRIAVWAEVNAFQCTHATTPLHWTEALKFFFCTLAHLQGGFDQPDQCFYWILSQKMCEEKQKCARRSQQKLKGGTFVSQQLHSCGHCTALHCWF